MSIVNRVGEILKSVDEMIRRIEAWMKDPQGGPVVPPGVQLVIENAAMVCGTGDIPESCRELATVAVPRFAEEFRGYEAREHGKYRAENGAPGPGFWAAAKAVASARAGSEGPMRERVEPVAVLLRQGVSHDQIAFHIYGRRGAGPFVQSNGTADVMLIEKEAATPGSVVPEDWVPDWQKQALDERKAVLASRLKAFDSLQTAKKYDDPATVEELLRDGAFVQQIEKVKNVSRAEVLAVAAKAGLAAVDGPGYHPGVEEMSRNEVPKDDVTDDTEDRVRSRAISLYTSSNGTKGAAEIAAELRQEGFEIHTNSVSALIGHWKKKAAKSAEVPAGAA